MYLATSDELPGLVAQWRTVAEALEIARDVARKLIEARREREDQLSFPTASDLQPLAGGTEKKSTRVLNFFSVPGGSKREVRGTHSLLVKHPTARLRARSVSLVEHSSAKRRKRHCGFIQRVSTIHGLNEPRN